MSAEVGNARYDTVVLAGGINTRELYPGYTPGFKALVELEGRPLIRYVLDALQASRSVGRIGIVGSEPDLRPIVGPDIPISPASESFLGSVMSGLAVFPDEHRILLTTADLAMLTAEVVDEFAALCARQQPAYAENLFISAVPKSAFTGPFAACGKLFMEFKDNPVCHGNLLMANPALLRNEAAMDRLNAVYAARKNIFTSALSFGLGLGLAYVFGVHLFHWLTMEKVAEMASERFGFGFVPLSFPHPEVAIDVDEAGDFVIAREVLAARESVERNA